MIEMWWLRSDDGWTCELKGCLLIVCHGWDDGMDWLRFDDEKWIWSWDEIKRFDLVKLGWWVFLWWLCVKKSERVWVSEWVSEGWVLWFWVSLTITGLRSFYLNLLSSERASLCQTGHDTHTWLVWYCTVVSPDICLDWVVSACNAHPFFLPLFLSLDSWVVVTFLVTPHQQSKRRNKRKKKEEVNDGRFDF